MNRIVLQLIRKSLICLVCLVWFNSSSYSQTKSIQTLDAWIKEKGYIKLTDVSHLPGSILSNYDIIKQAIQNWRAYSKKLDFQASYISIAQVHDNLMFLKLIVYPVEALRFAKYYEDKQTRENEDYQLKLAKSTIQDTTKDKLTDIQIIDDYGGTAGEYLLSLDKTSNKVSFSIYQ